MSNLNNEAYEIITKLETSYQDMLQRLQDLEQSTQQAKLNAENASLRAEQAEKALLDYQEQQEYQQEICIYIVHLELLKNIILLKIFLMNFIKLELICM